MTQMIIEIGQAISAAAGVCAAGTSAYFSPWLWRQRRIGVIRRRAAGSRSLALTYDDGPSAGVTPELLDMLRRHGARATFFVLGRQARQYPEIVDRIVREGHDIGCHSYAHLNAWKATPWKAVADIRSGYDALSAWIPADAAFRPPYGKMTLPTYNAVRRRGAPVWWWTVDSGDTKVQMPKADEVVAAVRRDQGGIVLMHDLDRGKLRNDYVLEVTKALLDLAVRESFKVVALKDLAQ